MLFIDALELITLSCLPNLSSAQEGAEVSASKHRSVLSKGFGARSSLSLPVHFRVLQGF